MQKRNPFDRLSEQEKHDATHFVQQRLLRESKIAASYESARYVARQISADTTDFVYRAPMSTIKKLLKEYERLLGF